MIYNQPEQNTQNTTTDGKVRKPGWGRYHWGIERNQTKDLYNITAEIVLEKNVRRS
jgi:hypothetical protein